MDSTTVRDWLLRRYPSAKRQTLKRMLEAGRVRVNGRPARTLKQPIIAEDRVEVSEKPARRPAHSAAPFPVVYEDEDLLVVNKPAGLLTSTVTRESRPTLLAQVRHYVSSRDRRPRVGLIHRLDRDASGLLIFSKNEVAYRSLKSQFYHHAVTREYRAVVHGCPDPPVGRIESCLVERADGTVHSTRQRGKGQQAVTEYEILKSQGKLSLLRVVLHTGRKHQIRAHLRERGTPVVGDRLYGPLDGAKRLMLAAVRLVIAHPRTGGELSFSLSIPPEFPVRPDGDDVQRLR